MRILLIDAHRMFREIVELYLRRASPDALVMHAASLGEAAVVLLGASPPDVAITEIEFAACRQVDAVRVLRRMAPRLQIAVLAAAAEPGYIHGAIRHGAMGYLLKTDHSEALDRGLSKVIEQRAHLPELALSMDEVPRQAQLATLDALEPGECALARMIACDLPLDAIAMSLGRSPSDARQRVARLLARLEVDCRTRLVILLAQWERLRQ